MSCETFFICRRLRPVNQNPPGAGRSAPLRTWPLPRSGVEIRGSRGWDFAHMRQAVWLCLTQPYDRVLKGMIFPFSFERIGSAASPVQYITLFGLL